MELKKLICDVCGGQIEMQSGGKGICTSCGTPYSAEIIKDKIQEIRGTVKIDGAVETVNGDAEKERLLNSAGECFKKGVVDEAVSIYRKITKQYPNEWRGWMGIIYCESLSLKNDDVKKHYIDWKENPETFLDDEYKKAISFAPEEEKLTIKSYICDFRKALNRRINRLKLETELDNKKAALKCKEYESTSNYKFGTGIIIGLLLILSGWVLFFVQSKIDSTASGIIALILLIVGNIVFFKSEPIYEIKGYFSHKHRKEIANNDVVKLKEDIQGISTKISEFKDKLED